MAKSIASIREKIRADALSEGFDAVAFTPAEAPEIQGKRLDAFLEDGFHGQMQWMAESRDRRASPTAMWPEARTALVLVMNYAPDHDPMDNLKPRDRGNISVYARGRDYHQVLKGRLKQIAGRIAAREGVEVKVFVDTAPLMEKPLAARAGLGWQGKHTNMVSRDYGSWLFLGVILTNADWAEVPEESEHCGSCTACLDICPTNAFPEPFRLDARRCISYLTIEHKGSIDENLRSKMGNRIYGCDDCQLVCPWNKFASKTTEADFAPRWDLDNSDLIDLFAWSEEAFEERLKGSPIRRIGYECWLRNIAIALGNATTSHAVVVALKSRKSDVSALVREHVSWALAQHGY